MPTITSRAAVALQRVLSSSGICVSPNGNLIVLALESRREEVHRRRADEPGHEEVLGPLVESFGRVDLLHDAAAHHRDAVAERHGLGLVVGHVDRRRLEPLLDPRHLGAHLHAQLGVEVRQRLVHQERLRRAHDRAAHRHALALAAGQVRRLALQVLLEVEDPRGLLDALGRSRPGSSFASLSAKPMLSRTVMCGYSA